MHDWEFLGNFTTGSVAFSMHRCSKCGQLKADKMKVGVPISEVQNCGLLASDVGVSLKVSEAALREAEYRDNYVPGKTERDYWRGLEVAKGR